MAKQNTKQDGSNVLSLNQYSGMCPMYCEQCFVNLGVAAQTRISSFMHPGNINGVRYAESQGWGGYKPDPSGKHLGLMTRKSAEKIPLLPREHAVKKPRKLDGSTLPAAAKARLQKLPPLLRVCDMSDSSLCTPEWLQAVRRTWGEDCFFNSTIRAVRRYPNMIRDHFHKVVVTANGGYQVAPLPGEHAGVKARKPKDEPADFLHPLSLTDIGLGEYDSRVKFYRLRGMATIQGRWQNEPDVPIVITKLRFFSMAYVCEFAQRYKLNIEVTCPTSSGAKQAAQFGVEAKRGPYSRVLLWTKKNDRRNASPHAGEASEFFQYKSQLRPKGEFTEYPWVCDRYGGGCAMCGLCASLDGTEPGNANPRNPIKPEPRAQGYVTTVGDYDTWVDYYDQATNQLSPEMFRNPSDDDLDWIVERLEECREYFLDDVNITEGWDTWNNVETQLVYCCWAVLRAGSHAGWSEQRSVEAVTSLLDRVGIAMDAVPLCRDLWSGESDWIETLGDVHA